MDTIFDSVILHRCFLTILLMKPLPTLSPCGFKAGISGHEVCRLFPDFRGGGGVRLFVFLAAVYFERSNFQRHRPFRSKKIDPHSYPIKKSASRQNYFALPSAKPLYIYNIIIYIYLYILSYQWFSRFFNRFLKEMSDSIILH